MASNADAIRLIKDYVAEEIAKAIKAHEAKAASGTFANSHVAS